jgi:hypothetical protein
VRQDARLWHGRSQFRVGHAGPAGVPVRAAQHRSAALLQDGDQRQSRGERAVGDQRADRRRNQQHHQPHGDPALAARDHRPASRGLALAAARLRRDHHSQAIKTKLQNFFVNYGRQGSPEQRKREQAILEQLEWDDFYKADDSALDQNRYIELRREEFELRGKTDAQSTARRAELEAQIAKLGYVGPQGD